MGRGNWGPEEERDLPQATWLVRQKTALVILDLSPLGSAKAALPPLRMWGVREFNLL